MADLDFTAANVGRSLPQEDVVYDYIAGVAITRGQAVKVDPTTGKLALADASAAATAQFRGIALKTVGADQAVSVLQSGRIEGFDLSGLNYQAIVYLSDTAGDLADAAGTVTVRVGRVVGLADSAVSKVLEIDVDMAAADWS